MASLWKMPLQKGRCPFETWFGLPGIAIRKLPRQHRPPDDAAGA
jgi:hypothetical protein